MCSIRILYGSALALAGHVEALWSVRRAYPDVSIVDTITRDFRVGDTFGVMRCGMCVAAQLACDRFGTFEGVHKSALGALGNVCIRFS